MSQLIKPIDYRPLLDAKQTEQGIKMIKEFFQQNLSTELRLRRVTAPLFVLKGLGINDDLNGVERAVTFPPPLVVCGPVGLGGRRYQGTAHYCFPEECGAAYLCGYPSYRVPDLRDLSADQAFPA